MKKSLILLFTVTMLINNACTTGSVTPTPSASSSSGITDNTPVTVEAEFDRVEFSKNSDITVTLRKHTVENNSHSYEDLEEIKLPKGGSEYKAMIKTSKLKNGEKYTVSVGGKSNDECNGKGGESADFDLKSVKNGVIQIKISEYQQTALACPSPTPSAK